MPLSLKEAEAAAYVDPSQENLAVYVKLLEEALEEAGDLQEEVDRLENAPEAAPSPDTVIDLENEVTELRDELRELRDAAQQVVDADDPAEAISELARALR